MTRRRAAVVALALVAALAVGASGCGANDNGGVITPPKTTAGTPTTVRGPGY